MGIKDQGQFEDDELDAIDDLEDTIVEGASSEDPLESEGTVKPYEQERINARHEIEIRNELKALKSELDEWDDLLDEDDL